jgi:hypothetical protein
MIKSDIKGKKCYVEVLNNETEEKLKIEGTYIGTVREVISKGSFITSIDVGLIYVTAEKRFLKAALEDIRFS